MNTFWIASEFIACSGPLLATGAGSGSGSGECSGSLCPIFPGSTLFCVPDCQRAQRGRRTPPEAGKRPSASQDAKEQDFSLRSRHLEPDQVL